jgi:predicted acylesterase/phospholipase RssA
LLASGTLPLLMKPVTDIAGAPPGSYWDGGIIDYHLALPYARAAELDKGALVLYPHFNQHIVPGWLDKGLPWRRTARGQRRAWLDNVLIVAPSQSFLKSLPRAKLPDRNDFKFYGMRQDERMRDWRQAMAEGERLRDELAEFAAHPDLSRIQPI